MMDEDKVDGDLLSNAQEVKNTHTCVCIELGSWMNVSSGSYEHICIL